MLEEEECIYNLIPKPPPEIVKEPLHKSKFQDQTAFLTAKKYGHATMGLPPEKLKQPPSQYLKKGERTKKLPPRERVVPKGNDGLNKPPVPKATETIKMKSPTKRNYILENWKQAPKTKKLHPAKPETWYTDKPDYGEVPAYMERVKKEAADEAEYWDNVRESMVPEDTETRCRLLSEEERIEILNGLYANLAENKKRYASLSFGQDNLSFRRKKEEMEREAAQLEADIKTFERPNVYITEN
ncbi:LOC402794 protein, putative [Trichomonas vaginalis G3]|uniref:LOC402794 protein, putative n=1 Tax=Trichomonas vaginalis (strain ATCC PRA-98 / G3) TaxID=412133 RepID=A2EMB8_TRIV3|nr:enkurin family [Trichomonas vaginalis G3]EAY06230.1 LOC402794 protein, putative [Trichomonas vaginalis G3]KAI5509640.1 enkurin family [Trichomonas vaginalis G3]|eukprot:XP_001318453.1 LOC402794 protein [Trichomonas vaginalis G3]